MTTQNVSCYKGLPIKITARAGGYWDYEEIKTFDEAQTYNITMQPYDGLDYSVYQADSNPISAEFAVSLLPNNKWAAPETKVFMPYDNGKTYYNTATLEKNAYMDISGCTITSDNQCTLTGGTSAVFNSSKVIPATATSVKMIFKMTLKNYSTTQIVVLTNNGPKFAEGYVQGASHMYKGYFDNTAVGGVTTLVQGNTYWFGVLEDASTIKGYLLADNGTYTLDTLPDFAQWSEEWSQNVTTTSGFKGSSLSFFNNLNQYWRGSIDLNNCKIWVDGEDFWYYNILDEVERDLKGCLYNYTDTGAAATLNCFYYNNTYVLTADSDILGGINMGQVEVPAHDLYTYSDSPYQVYDNFTVVGTSLIIDQETGKVSGFSSSSYLDTGYRPDLSDGKPWKMRVRFKYTKVNSFQVFLSGTTYANAPYIAVGTNYLVDCGISNGSSRITWIEGTTVLEDGVNYIVEFSYDGNTTYTVRLKQEDGSWNTENTYTYDGKADFGSNLYIGRNGSGYARGIIDLSTDTYFEIDGVQTWIPTTTHYKTTWTKQS